MKEKVQTITPDQLNQKQLGILVQVENAFEIFNSTARTCVDFKALNYFRNSRVGFTNPDITMTESNQLYAVTDLKYRAAENAHKNALGRKRHDYGCPAGGVPASLDKRVHDKILKKMGY